MSIESAVGDTNVFGMLQEGVTAIEGLTKHVNIEKLEDIKEKIED